MKTNKLIIAFIMLIACVMPVIAQKKGATARNREWRKEMLDFKVKFLSKEMELRDDQQKTFATLYAQMMQEKHLAMEKAREAERNLKKIKSPSDEDYKIASAAMQKAREEDAVIDKKFDEKFSSFLTQKQIFKMKEGERKFRDKLMKMRHKHRKEKGDTGCIESFCPQNC